MRLKRENPERALALAVAKIAAWAVTIKKNKTKRHSLLKENAVFFIFPFKNKLIS